MQDRGDAIVLIGFMGTGKSSVGRELARRRRLPRYDTDEMVTQRFGVPIPEIFAQHGEAAFRDAEADALAHVPALEAIVVTGGGLLLRDGHIARVRSLGTVVQLTAAFETLLERLARRPSRPLLQTADPRTTVEQLLSQRGPLYAQAADLTVDTTGRNHGEVADAVLADVERFRGYAI